MAQVPAAAAAAVKSNSSPSVKPALRKPGSKKTEAERTGTIEKYRGERKIFSDVLKKVGKTGQKPSVKNSGSSSILKTRESAVIKEPEKLLIEEPAAEAAVNSLDNAQSQTASVDLIPVQRNPVVNNLRPPRTARVSKRTKSTKLQNAGRSTGVRSLTTAGNSETVRKTKLSSSAPRVEVIDNREFAYESENRTTGNEAGNRKSRRPVNTPSQKVSIEPVRLDHNSAVAEADIEISGRADGKTLQKSAAAELAQKLDAQAGNDIVRQVKVILNQADSGEVRINLRPDNLGQVKIRIRMDDNRLTGRIFVESAAAREAFKNALDGLQTRLVDSGFGAADLEMAWDDSPRGFMQNGDQQQGQKGTVNKAIQEFDNITPTVFTEDSVESRVNMVI